MNSPFTKRKALKMFKDDYDLKGNKQMDYKQIDYKHIFCKCGGIIGEYKTPKRVLECDKCRKVYQWHEIKYDYILSNTHTGWTFPVSSKTQ